MPVRTLAGSACVTASRRSEPSASCDVHGAPVGEERHGQAGHLLQCAFVVRQFGEGCAGVSEEAGGLFGPLAGRDVTGDLRCADDLSVRPLDRRDRQGHIDPAAILPQPLRFKMFDVLAPLEPLHDLTATRQGGREGLELTVVCR